MGGVAGEEVVAQGEGSVIAPFERDPKERGLKDEAAARRGTESGCALGSQGLLGGVSASQAGRGWRREYRGERSGPAGQECSVRLETPQRMLHGVPSFHHGGQEGDREGEAALPSRSVVLKTRMMVGEAGIELGSFMSFWG